MVLRGRRFFPYFETCGYDRASKEKSRNKKGGPDRRAASKSVWSLKGLNALEARFPKDRES